MKNCTNCGNTMDERDVFCNKCGTPAKDAVSNKQKSLERISVNMNRERIAYKAFGIAYLVIAILLIVIGIVSMVSGAYLATSEIGSNDIIFDSYSYNIDGYDVEITEDDVFILAGSAVIAVSGFYIGFGCALLAIAIVNLVISSKIKKYRSDETLMVNHAGSVGSIVLAALFNDIALIFVIINFVTAKKHRAALESR